MNAKEIKARTGAKTKAEGISILYATLENRPWQLNGQEALLCGYDSRRDRVHFSTSWSVEPGVAGYRRVVLSLEAALMNVTGDLSNATVVC